MKKVFKELLEGDSRKRLSIAADLSTILGVSVATIVAGPFLSEFANIEFILSDFIIAILFYFICVYLFVSALFSILKEALTNIREKKYHELAGLVILSLLFAWLTIVFFPYAKYYFGNAFNVSYLLPLEANKAVNEIDILSFTKNDDLLRISGVVKFHEQSKPEDYLIMLYSQNKEGLYTIRKFYSSFNADYTATISDDGTFATPLAAEPIALENLYIVIYRKSDWSLLNELSNQKGYPDDLTKVPAREIDDIGGYTHQVQLNKKKQSDA